MFLKKGIITRFKESPLRSSGIHKFYFVIAGMCGLIMVFLIPPFRSPDETGHYLRAAALSEGQPFCVEGQLLVSKKKIYFVKYCGIEAENTIPKTFPDISELLNYQDVVDKGKEFFPTRTCQRFPIANMIPALGIKFGNLLGLNELYSYYLARIFNLSFSAIVITLAIRFIPSGKYVFASLGLLPTFIFLSSTVHYDAVSVPLQFLFISYIFFLRKKKQDITVIQIMLLITIFLVFSSAKPGYQPLLFLLLVLKDPKIFKRKYSLYILIVIFIILGLAITILPLLTLSSGFYARNTDGNKQLFFILTNPINFLLAIFESLKTFGIKHYLYGFLGSFDWFNGIISWPKYNLHPIHYFLLIANLLFFIPLHGKYLRLTKLEKVLLTFIFVFILLLIFAALYISMAPLGHYNIHGVQGRYFIGISPLILLVYYSLVKQRQRLLKERLFNKIFLFFMVLNASATIWVVYVIYHRGVPSLFAF